MENHFLLDKKWTFLNHGSFGAMSTEMWQEFLKWQQIKNKQPVHFFARMYPDAVQNSIKHLSSFMNADVNNLFFIRNATTGVNTVLSNLTEMKGTILTTNHKYNAVKNALVYTQKNSNLQIITIDIDIWDNDQEVISKFEQHITCDTRLIVIDHIASMTSRVFPIKQITDLAHQHNIEILIDAAHTPGQLNIDLNDLQADYWTGNCHKWLGAPQGAAALYVHPSKQLNFHPSIISHGYKQGLHEEFHWLGTDDYIAWLCVPKAIELHNMWGGPKFRVKNSSLCEQAIEILSQVNNITPLKRTHDLAMHSFLLSTPTNPRELYQYLQQHLIECVVDYWDDKPLLRISCFTKYNTIEQYQSLAMHIDKYLNSK
jgi:isopenicillin-N epimerase